MTTKFDISYVPRFLAGTKPEQPYAKQILAYQNMVMQARHIFNNDGLIIAGGAVRDALSQVKVKDIDIFIKIDEEDANVNRGGGDWDYFIKEEIDALKKKLNKTYINFGELFHARCETFAAAYGGTPIFKKGNPGYSTFDDICDIEVPLPHRGDGACGMIQIVGIYGVDPIDDVPCYDFGLSQAFVTTNGLYMTDIAMHDRMNKTITFTPYGLPDKASMDCSKARLGRLREKYEGWTFVNCEVLDAHIPKAYQATGEYDNLLGGIKKDEPF